MQELLSSISEALHGYAWERPNKILGLPAYHIILATSLVAIQLPTILFLVRFGDDLHGDANAA